MKTLWNVTKTIFTVTGAWIWIGSIVEVIKDRNKEPEPIVQPVMLPRQK